LSGDIVALADGSGLTNENYEFSGWALTADGEALEISEYVITADTTFYAVWTPAEMSDAEDTSDQEGDEEVISLPDTGDSLDLLWFLLLMSAGAALTVEALRLRRKLIKK
jgi:uncharacterized membrane protein